jgi:hypothetical protein
MLSARVFELPVLLDSSDPPWRERFFINVGPAERVHALSAGRSLIGQSEALQDLS